MPRPAKVEEMLRAFFTAEGHTTPALRRAIAHRAGGPVDLPTPADAGTADVSPQLDALIDKIARHAHKVTDEDIAALRAGGLTEDALFETTLAAALGASLKRMDAGLRALAAAGPTPTPPRPAGD